MAVCEINIVPFLDGSPAFIFPVKSFTLSEGSAVMLGRTTENHNLTNTISFKSKVVSRKHAVIWVENGNVYIKDTQSSSGTFLNGRPLSAINSHAVASKLKHNDIIQLGVNYHKGYLDIHKCVKMKIEINKDSSPTYYNIQTLESLYKLLSIQNNNNNNHNNNNTLDECCICLYAIAPKQALFISPCAHSFHFKCIHPLLKQCPEFKCPLCRSSFDLKQDY